MFEATTAPAARYSIAPATGVVSNLLPATLILRFVCGAAGSQRLIAITAAVSAMFTISSTKAIFPPIRMCARLLGPKAKTTIAVAISMSSDSGISARQASIIS